VPTISVPLPAALGLVAAGGAVGSVVRYLINAAATSMSTRFPYATLFANALGCFLAGILLFFVMQRDQPSLHLRLLLATGFLGGLTTFSAFGFETVQLFLRGQIPAAFLNIAANVALSLGAVFLGFAAARALA